MNKQAQIIAEFSRLTDWELKYKLLIEKGKKMPPLSEEHRKEENLIKGCQSQVWLYASLTPEGKIAFSGDSDALIVKGLLSVVLEVYNECTPDHILTHPPDFLKELGFEKHLTPSRANGLFSMIRQIQYYAAAYKVLLRMPAKPEG